MKKNKIKSLLALAIAAVVAFNEPVGVLAVKETEVMTEAAEEKQTEEKSSESELQTESESPKNTETESESSNSTETESESSNSTETESESSNSTETESESSNSTETESESSNSTETESETETGTTKLATDIEKDDYDELSDELSLKAMGFKPMELDDAMLEEKSALAEVADSLNSMTADEDYDGHVLVYYADSQEMAEQIAECYNGQLIDYEYGVAAIEIEKNASDAIKLAADPDVGLPAVYPNIYYYIDEEELQVVAEDVQDEEPVYASAPNDPDFGKQWHHNTINTLNAWDATKGSGVVVAVLDTGIDVEHPDLKDNIKWYISTITSSTEKKKAWDYHSHGTHCAGIIAAKADNGVGIAGVAPEAGIMSVKVLGDSGGGSTKDIIQGINAAVSYNVDVISMSLGSPVWDRMTQNAVTKAVNKGIVVVAAAGNAGDTQKHYPASYNDVISVAATSEYGGLTSFSTYGSWVDIAAPGGNIYSTVPTYLTSSGYDYKSGTSMACPVVAGTAALILAGDSGLRNTNSRACVDKVRNILLGSTKKTAGWFRGRGTYPLVDAEASVFSTGTSRVEKPQIRFTGAQPDGRKVVLAGAENFFELTTTTERAKIYYTMNGKTPTAKTGTLYTGMVPMDRSGKVTIKAIAYVGTKKSSVFSSTYTFDVKAASLQRTCGEELKVAIGKSIQLGVDIVPSYVSVKSLSWTSSDESKMINVNSKGKVTCNKNTPENTSAVITATTKDGTNLSCTFNVVATSTVTGNITLDVSSVKMSRYVEHYEDIDMKKDGYVSEYKLAPTSDTGISQFIFKSSNTKVATVDANGVIRPVAKGKADITVTANDGSGKKAKCAVTVVTPVHSIDGVTSTGFSVNYYKESGLLDDYVPIAVGCTISIKTTINEGQKTAESKASNAGLEWSSDNPTVTVSNGKVTCKSSAIPGTYATITAKAKDGFGAEMKYIFEVKDRARRLYISSWWQKVNPYNVNLRVGGGIYDPLKNGSIKADWVKGVGQNVSYFDIKTSNREAVYRTTNSDGKWVIWGTKAGTSRITYTLRDGSNVKFIINFKVQ